MAARRLLTAAAAGFPAATQPFHDIARLAEADHDWPAAEQAWRGFLTLDAGEWWVHTGLAHALRRQRRFDEADRVLASQFTRLAHEPAMFFEYAGIAEDRGDWAEAVRRYHPGRAYPDRPHAALGLTYMLARLGRRPEGDDSAAPGHRRPPARLKPAPGLRPQHRRNRFGRRLPRSWNAQGKPWPPSPNTGRPTNSTPTP